MTPDKPALNEAVKSLLESNNVPHRLHEHLPLLTVQDIEGSVPFPREKWVKALAFQVKGDGWVIAALQAHTTLDYRKLADALSVKRSSLAQASPENVHEHLGFQAGGVAPFPTRPDVRVVYDSRLQDIDIAYCGTGRSDLTLEIAMADLLRVVKPIVAPISS